MSGFATTRWSLIRQARDEGADGRAALDELCRGYREPVAAYVRHHGARASEVEDLVQAFFLHFVEHELHARADPLRGGFRPFLLTALRNFLRSAAETARAGKRGGGVPHEREWLDTIPADNADPERAFDRAWAMTVVRRALDDLHDESRRTGRAAMFDAVQPCLVEAPDAGDYRRIGATLGMAPNTVAVAVKRLRARLRERIREQLLQTVADEPSLAREMELLRGAL